MPTAAEARRRRPSVTVGEAAGTVARATGGAGGGYRSAARRAPEEMVQLKGDVCV